MQFLFLDTPITFRRKLPERLTMRELSLRPYNGTLFIAKTPKDYEASHKRLFGTEDKLNKSQCGRFCADRGKDGMTTYLVWGKATPQIAHEIAHVVLHTFDRCGIDPISGNGEPFCCMLSQLMIDARNP